MGMLRRLTNLLRRQHHTDEIDRELAFHLAEREDDLLQRGMSPEVARREARRQFGHVGTQREETRDAGILPWLEALAGDVKYALRSLRWSKGFTAVTVASLALGIGANTAIFSLINAAMLRDLPVRDPQELVIVGRVGDDEATEFTNPLWEQVRDGQDMFSAAAAWGSVQFDLASAGEQRMVEAAWISGSFFPTLGVRPLLGRLPGVADDVRGCAPVVAVSFAFWQAQLGGDPQVLGRTLALRGQAVPIIGVAPPEFRGLETGTAPQLFVPLCADAALLGSGSAAGGFARASFLDHRSYWSFRIVGRLKDGVTAEQASARVAQLSAAWFANTLPGDWAVGDQEGYLASRMTVQPSLDLLSSVRQRYATALWTLMAIVGLVLLVACANVANLVLARSAVRQRELAVRAALGASRARLVRQLLVEGLLLSTAGALAGIALAYWGSRALVAMLSTSRETVVLDLSVDATVLGFSLAVGVGTALLFSMVPAWRVMRTDARVALQAHGRGAVAGHSRFGVSQGLVAAQVAISLILVTGAALLLGSFGQLSRRPLGFQPDQVLVVAADLKLPPDQEARAVVEQGRVLERLRSLPGVEEATASFNTPLSRMAWNSMVVVPGVTFENPGERQVWVNEVWDRYFATLGMQLEGGRDFGIGDGPGSPRVAIINQAGARRFFPNTNPIGQVFRLEEGPGNSAPIEVVGVVADAPYRSRRAGAEPTVFFPLRQDTTFGGRLTFAVRSALPEAELRAAILQAFSDVAPRAGLSVSPLSRQVAESLTRERLLARLSGFFGGLALLLAMIGLYGTLSYAVARRRRELGVRLALGAAPGRVQRDVLGEVAVVLGVGLALGCIGVVASTRLLASFLYGLTPTEPAVIAGSTALLAVVSLLAAWVPARRAARLDPMRTLREE